ncbi:hypothetical protein ACN28S_22735 [Cystobacter fuscus]
MAGALGATATPASGGAGTSSTTIGVLTLAATPASGPRYSGSCWTFFQMKPTALTKKSVPAKASAPTARRERMADAGGGTPYPGAPGGGGA